MGIASLVIGIVAIITCFIPLCGYFVLIPAVVGLVLGIIDYKLKKKAEKPYKMALTGFILNLIAVILSIIMGIVLASALNNASNELEKISTQFQSQNFTR